MVRWIKYVGYVRDLRGCSAERQRKAIDDYVHQRGGKMLAVYTDGNRDEWVRRMRSDEVAIVFDTFVIAEPATKGKRPAADYAGTIVRLMQRSGLVVAASRNITSGDGEAWENLVEDGALQVAKGRTLSSKRARAMAEKSNAGRDPEVVARWRKPSMRAELARWKQHWRDPQFPSAEKALAAMPADVRAGIGTVQTAYRIFRERRPGNPRAGGRPKKTTKPKRKP